MVGTVVGGDCQRLDRSADGDHVGRYNDFGDEPACVTLPGGSITRAQLAQDDFAEPIDCFGGHLSIGGGQLPLDQHDFLFQIRAAAALASEAGGEVGIARGHDALFDEVEHVLDRAFDPCALGAERLEVRLPLAHRGRTVVEQVGKQLLKPLGVKQPLGHGINDDVFELPIANAGPLARGLAAPQPASTHKWSCGLAGPTA